MTKTLSTLKKHPARQTPMMRQYMELKEQTPDCILFFRMGDFYEMFFEDAQVASKALSISLTSRDKGQPDPIPMCGVPHRTLDSYLAKMVEAGFKVAVCDQVEDPKSAKGLVRREITRVVSPGMFTDPEHLPARDNLFLAALCLSAGKAGLACLDLSSGEFRATAVEAGPPLNDELARLEPAELILAESQMEHPGLSQLSNQAAALPRTSYTGKPPTPNQAREILGQRLPMELEDGPKEALAAAAMAWGTVLATQRRQPEHVEELELYQVETHLILDASARRNLEIFRSLAGKGRKGSLLHSVDRTSSPMGGRLLREWLGFPLTDQKRIEARQQAVDELVGSHISGQVLKELLAELPDMPRLVGRAGLGQATPRDLAALRDGLLALPELGAELCKLGSPIFAKQKEQILGLDELAETLRKTLTENPPISLADGGVIAPGVDPDLDEQRSFSTQGKDWIASLQAKLKTETGIPSLKVGFNRVFGYYIEVTKTHLNKVPEDFIRKQTLAASERYITPELKEWESKVLGAEEKALELEKTLFLKLRREVADHSRPLMACSRALAVVDVLASLAELALSKDWQRPVLKEDGPLEIKAGRHPVVEDMLPEGEFVPNDIHLDDQEQQVMIITGPNMAGKSTILRQTALIVLLAQTGSFVPAESARIPVTDRIFTRVGAMDDLAGGLSTFMVEMTETSRILKQATSRSLVILDEVGRGTSTYDGLSIAWAVAEHLHNLDQKGVKTLFATHYHELTDLAGECPRVKNYNVAAKEYQGGIVFLRKLKPGGVSRSYGLQVAKLAGLPQNVLERAQDILNGLEKNGHSVKPAHQDNKTKKQLPLFETALHPVLRSLKELETDNLTPVQALTILDEMKRAVS